MAESQFRPVGIVYEGDEDRDLAMRVAASMTDAGLAPPLFVALHELEVGTLPAPMLLAVLISDPPYPPMLDLLARPGPKVAVFVDAAARYAPGLPAARVLIEREGPFDELVETIRSLTEGEPAASIPLTNSVQRARRVMIEPVTAYEVAARLLRGHPDPARRAAADDEILKAMPPDADRRSADEWIVAVLGLLDQGQANVLHARLLVVGVALVDRPLGRWMAETGLLQEIEDEIEEPVRLLLNDTGRALRDALEGTVLAGYAPDSVTGHDLLGIETDVAALSAVLATRSNEPPLSVGLFGRWGTGKSFFMARMRERIESLGRDDPETYCSNVVQITFNAWHYIDANLWASLVARIFEELANHGRNGEDAERQATENLLENLRISEEALARARRAEREAREHKEEVGREVAGLTDRRGREKSELASLRAGQITATVAESESVRTELSSLSQSLGIDTSAAEAAALWHARLRGPGGRLVAAWRYLRARPGRLALVLLAVVLAVVAAVAIAVAASSLIAAAVAAVLPVLAVVATAGVAIARVAAPVARFLNSVDEARQARTIQLDMEMRELEAQLAQREQERRQAETAERAARDALEKASSGTVLRRFVEERAASDHYARHLGVIGSVQRDFERLSDLMSRREPGEVPRDEQGRELPPIDRIVLYVDDLDRCPTRLVVEVLQAVHLLLAFPLFVVVVGVDPRWLTTSLERHHAALMASASDRPLSPG
ncbi:MAG TPA: P-loop NTPase fold protein, partial [Thermoleophilaceae bacterium]